MNRRWVFLLALWIAACTTDGTESPMKSGQAPRMVWPNAPETPRIEFVSQFRSADDLGLRESFGHNMRQFLTGGDDRHMTRPYAVAADNDTVVVADPGAALVHWFDTRHKKYLQLKAAGDFNLASPVSVALGENRLFIADSERNMVFILDHRFKLLSVLEDFQRPTGLAFDPGQQRLYVADTLAHEIQVYGQDGQFQFRIGERGEQDTQFNYPSHITFAGDHLYVNDTMNFRIQVLDPKGRHLRTFGKHGTGSGYFAQPKGVAVDSQGHVYVADALANRVQIFDQNGVFLLGFGNIGDGPGGFQMPSGLAIWNDLIYVADSRNQRIQVFRYLREEN